MSSTLHSMTPRNPAPPPSEPTGSTDAQCTPLAEPSPPSRPSGDIIICERRIAIGTPVVNWQDDPRFSAYRRCGYRGEHDTVPVPYPFHPASGMEQRTMRYRPRKELLGRRTDLGVLKRVIRQTVLHHDGAESSAQCFHVLHDERGLSAHFLIDNDGTIYQTLDLADVAFHAQTANSNSIGIELCNRGRVGLPASEASQKGREPQWVRVHGYEYHTWSFTAAQYQALSQLLSALLSIFPELARAYPNNGGPIYSALAAPERFSGILGHYHLTARKWDPGCFDFARLMKSVGGHPVWFAAAAPTEPLAAGDAARQHLLAANEQRAAGGFYPVGPCGDDLVWHGGIHLALAAGAPLYSPIAGRIVAARARGTPTATGSADFVLIRYDQLVQGQRLDFCLLLYHLNLQADGALQSQPDWLRQLDPEVRRRQSAQGVFFPAAEVATGGLVGFVGSAGPSGSAAPQVHVEIMAGEKVSANLTRGAFQIKDCAGAGLVCLDRELHQALGGQSVLAFVRSTRSDPQAAARLHQLRQLAVRSPSEWAIPRPTELARLCRESPAFRSLSAAQMSLIMEEQLAPHWWLTAEVAERVGLPTDLLVWHYHPIEFLAWVGELLGQRGRGAESPQLRLTTRPPGPAEDGARGDDGYASEEDLGDWELGVDAQLSLEDVARGFPAHWLAGAR